MKKGDKVKLIDEKGIFIVKAIVGNQAILADEYGFENKYALSSIIPCLELENILTDFNIDEVMEEKKTKSKNKPQKNTPKKQKYIKEIDLHIGHLVDSLKNIEPYQMLQKQLITARQEIEKAKQEKVDKLILIHGKGKGVLKTELYKLLDSINDIEYWEADIIKYRFGAVEIRFK